LPPTETKRFHCAGPESRRTAPFFSLAPDADSRPERSF
jgi:hypothetical protein